MKDLIKVALVLALAFASTFVIMRLTGVLSDDRVRAFLAEAHTIHPGWFVALVVGLMLLDLLIAIPTMTTILLAGYFLGACTASTSAMRWGSFRSPSSSPGRGRFRASPIHGRRSSPPSG